jgi:hypothetical protein
MMNSGRVAVAGIERSSSTIGVTVSRVARPSPMAVPMTIPHTVPSTNPRTSRPSVGRKSSRNTSVTSVGPEKSSSHVCPMMADGGGKKGEFPIRAAPSQKAVITRRGTTT